MKLKLAAFISLLCAPCVVSALDADVRLKWFTTASALPSHDVQRVTAKTPMLDHSADVRVMLREHRGPVKLLADYSVVWLNGATSVQIDPTVDQTAGDDGRRWADLTWNMDTGRHHRSFHRFDRLAVQWQPGDWSVTLGRQAVSWGSGMVFQPMDLFSPFSPTVVDRDYKAGDDLLLIDRLLKNGHDLQLLHVVRRDVRDHVNGNVSSTALKWHGYAGTLEFEAVAARHYDKPVYAATLRIPVGQALVRSDIVTTRDLRDNWQVSGIVNLDYSFTIGERNAYLFGEYFHNGWGVDKLPATPLQLPQDLLLRLERGELFNIMRDYVALGGSFEWHPLWSQTATLITNLHDSSSLLQIQFSYRPGDNQSLDFGFIEPIGRAGDEFGGIPVLGKALTTGGATRGYLRWVYYL